MHALKQQWNMLGIGALAWADKVKPGASEANVRMSREGLTSTNLPMKWTDVTKSFGLVFLYMYSAGSML